MAAVPTDIGEFAGAFETPSEGSVPLNNYDNNDDGRNGGGDMTPAEAPAL
jgi:hypothetical protein